MIVLVTVQASGGGQRQDGSAGQDDAETKGAGPPRDHLLPVYTGARPAGGLA